MGNERMTLPPGTARFVWDSFWAVVPLALLVASFACFGYIALFIWLALSEARVRQGMGLEGTRNALRDLFVATFSLFPVAHLLSFTGILDPVMEEMAYCWGDMLMKVIILGNVAVENVFETRQDMLRRVKEKQKNKMLEQLQTSVESGDKFISMVSHELRTPIHGIMGLAEALLMVPKHRGGGPCNGVDGAEDADLGSSLSQRATPGELHSIRAIAKSGRGLLDLVNNLLAHASLRAGGTNLVVEKRPFNIAEVVRHCVDMKNPYLASGVTISAEIDDDVCDGGNNSAIDRKSGGDGQIVTVMGDPMRIEQVILNLVNNAIRHTTAGFVKVKVRRAKPSELAANEDAKANVAGIVGQWVINDENKSSRQLSNNRQLSDSDSDGQSYSDSNSDG